MTWTPQNPRDALSKMDKLVFGVDATRHPLLGCPIGHGNGEPKEQARNYLRSLLSSGLLTDDEFKHWAARLIKWETAGGIVRMPPREVSADHRV